MRGVEPCQLVLGTALADLPPFDFPSQPSHLASMMRDSRLSRISSSRAGYAVLAVVASI